MREIKTGGNYATPRRIVAALGAYLIVDLLAVYFWSSAGPVLSIQAPSDSNSTLPVTAMAGVGLWLCLRVLRSFPVGSPLRSAWMLIAFAAAAQAGSGVMAELLGSDWVLNPLLWTGSVQPALLAHIRLGALIAAGPIRLAALAGALLAALRTLRKFGFCGRPSATDWAVCGIACLFSLCRFAEAGAASLAGRETSMQNWISLASLPLLCVLFLEAMLLTQAVLRMGSGPVARCWSAFVWGIFSIGLTELALWLVPHYSRAPLGMVESLARFLTAAIFALAPAYQLAAQAWAMKMASRAEENLATEAPAVAR